MLLSISILPCPRHIGGSGILELGEVHTASVVLGVDASDIAGTVDSKILLIWMLKTVMYEEFDSNMFTICTTAKRRVDSASAGFILAVVSC